MYIYIYISAAPPKGEQSVLKPRCRILRAPWAPTLPPALPNRVEVFAPNFDEKLNPHTNQPKVPKWSPHGPPDGDHNRENPQKCRLGDLSPAWQSGTWLKCMRVVKQHTYQRWPKGRPQISEMPPKRHVLGATLAPNSQKCDPKKEVPHKHQQMDSPKTATCSNCVSKRRCFFLEWDTLWASVWRPGSQMGPMTPK